MTDRYTTNHNYRVEYIPYYGDHRGHPLNLPLLRNHKTAIFRYNRIGALKVIENDLVNEFMNPTYTRPDQAVFKIWNRNREVQYLRIVIVGNSDLVYSDALDQVKLMIEAEARK